MAETILPKMVKIVKEETIPRGRHTDSTVGATFFRIKQLITKSSSFSRVTGLTLLLLLFATPFVVTHRQIFQPHAAGGAPDVTSSVEMLGNPSMSRYPSDPYSRNVWDMQAFNNKIYIGSGDFLANTGPVPILAYDTSSNQFVTDSVINSNEGTSVDEEQINEFDVTNNQIYIPGTDPRDSNGEFYRLEANGWTKYPTINNAVHDWSMASYNNQLFISINSTGNTSPIDISNDNGQTWQSASYVNPQGNPATIVSGYGGSFFQINGVLYTSSNITIQDGSSQITSNIFKYVGNNQFMIVENSPLNSPNPVRPINYNNGVLYIGLTSPIKTDFYNYGNLYFSTSINSTQQITLPANMTVWDLLQRGSTAYALTNAQQGDGSYITSVLSSTDGVNWTELFHFSEPTFAVSFEEHNGDFYFGLGTHHTPLMTQAGNILRVKQAAYMGGSPTPTPSVIPLPIISRNVPAYASANSSQATLANDNDYGTVWNSGTSLAWIAYDLSSVPAVQRSKVLAVYYNNSPGGYSTARFAHTSNLGSYTIDINSAPGGTTPPTSGWTTVVTVTNNTWDSRQNLIDMTGANWIRINATVPDSDGTNNDFAFNFDVYNATQGATDDWIFYGDSITSAAMHPYPDSVTGSPTFATQINQANSAYFPVQEDGGEPSDTSTDAVNRILGTNGELSVFPGKYVALDYGMNDAGGGFTPTTFYNNMKQLVQAVIAAGKIPIIPTINYTNDQFHNTRIPDFNNEIFQLYSEFPQIIHGPDFWTFFKNNQNLITPGDIHPTSQGYAAMRQMWANTMYSEVYQGIAPTPVPTITPTPTPSSNFSTSVSVSPLPVTVGQSETINSSLTNLTSSTIVGEVKLSVFDPQGNQVFSQLIPSSGNMQFVPNTPRVNTASFTLSLSSVSGSYSIDEGVVATDGVTVLYDNPNASSFSVSASTLTPTPTPTFIPTPTPTPKPTATPTPTPTPKPAIPGDLNNTGSVDAIDLSILLSSWGSVNDTINQELGRPQGSSIDVLSLSVLLSHWTL